MNGHQWLTERFDECRQQLRAVAHRMLGNRRDADAALIQARLRISRGGDDHASSNDPRSPGPDADALLADSLGYVLLDGFQALTPTERLAFVLHQLFGLPFTEIAPMLALSPAAAAEAARHARRRLHGPALGTLRVDDSDAVRRPSPSRQQQRR